MDQITMAVVHGGVVVDHRSGRRLWGHGCGGAVVDHKDMVQKEVDYKMLQEKQLVIVPSAGPMGMAKGNQ